jgi:HD-like signal output (HDOD) protein
MPIMNTERNLRQALKKLDNLPAIPNIAMKILSLSLSTDANNDELLELIVQDPPIMSKIIGLSNSPLFNTGRIINRLGYAVALLGYKRVKVIAMSFSIISSMTRKQPGSLDIQYLWNRGLTLAKVMETLAGYMPKHSRPLDDEIYLAGLLHDIGFLILDYMDPELSDQFHARLNENAEYSIEELESELLGISHGEIGAILGRSWNLPSNIVASIYNKQDFDSGQSMSIRSLVALTGVAEKLLPVFCRADETANDISEADWQSLEIDINNADKIGAKIQKTILDIGAVKL